MSLMKKRFFIVFASLFAVAFALYTQPVLAQSKTKPKSTPTSSEERDTPYNSNDGDAPNRKGRFTFGGDIGFNFYNNNIYLRLAPLIGYYFSNKYEAGLGPSFEYYKQTGSSFNAFGGRVYNRLYPIDRINLFLHGEYNIMSYKNSLQDGREIVMRLPVGAGYQQSLGGKASANLTVLYDLLYQKYKDTGYNHGYLNGFPGLIIQGGVNIGL